MPLTCTLNRCVNFEPAHIWGSLASWDGPHSVEFVSPKSVLTFGDGPHSVCGMCISLNKSVSYLKKKKKVWAVCYVDLCCFCCCLVTQLCQLFVTPWTVAHQAPLSMGFPRLAYRSGLPFPFPEDLPDAGIEPMSPALTGCFHTAEPPRRPPMYISPQYKWVNEWMILASWGLQYFGHRGKYHSLRTVRLKHREP